MEQCFTVTPDLSVKRLRWVMVAVILFDSINTILGQPGTYWQYPQTAVEGNPFFHFFISRGLLDYLLCNLIYISVAFILVSITCRRIALIIAMSLILGHFFGASSWLVGPYGVEGVTIYSIILAVVVVHATYPLA
jgi:hypothetical protein